MLQLRRNIVQVRGLFRWRPTGKQSLLLAEIMGPLLIISIFIGGYYFSWTWTGFGEYTGNLPIDSRAKTLWDWMQLLIVPAVLAGGVFLLNQLSTRTQNEIADNNQREVALQTYIDRMSELLLDKGLRGSKEDAEIRKVARTRTLAVFRRLDRDRKGILVQFLQEAKLVSKSDASQSETITISLSGADLSDAKMSHANLLGADLSHADLSGAKMSHTNLLGADLSFANLRGANLRVANLSHADLSGATLSHADLSGATLSHADLSVADLSHADLSGATLSHADLSAADLRGANLNIAKISDEQLDSAKSLKGTIMPDGSKHP